MRNFINFIKSFCYVRNDRFYQRLAALEKQVDCRKEIACMAERQLFLMRQFLAQQYKLNGDVEKIRETVTAQQAAGSGGDFFPVVFLTDEKYAYPTFIAVFSLLHHCTPEMRYKIYILGDGLSPLQQELFSLFGEQVEYRSASPSDRAKVPHIHVSDTALLKFELPEIFPELEKILYLDSDVLVRRNLAALQDIEMPRKLLAAVLDPCETQKRRAKGEPDARYFNSGVMLLNLEEMRRRKLPQLCKKLKAQEQNHLFMDQDVLNQACSEDFAALSPEYNYCADNIFDQKISLRELAQIYDLDVETMRKVQNSPAIWHYSNAAKPWNSHRNIRSEEWIAEEVLASAVFPQISGMSN